MGRARHPEMEKPNPLGFGFSGGSSPNFYFTNSIFRVSEKRIDEPSIACAIIL